MTQSEYIDDALGRRIAKVVSGTTTYYVYDTQYRILEERDGAGSLLARYTYGAGIDEPLMMERGGDTYYYHRDALGSVTEMTNAAGALVERYEYDVYGQPIIFNAASISLTASAIGNSYMFTARQYDPESGNYYYRARMYSPWIGRFLQMDPWGYVDSLNMYAYVNNVPTLMNDPEGRLVGGPGQPIGWPAPPHVIDTPWGTVVTEIERDGNAGKGKIKLDPQPDSKKDPEDPKKKDCPHGYRRKFTFFYYDQYGNFTEGFICVPKTDPCK